mmetsp:Transcript_64635/g.140356  ORF Transcript_64635/g.140356 Transcript_64635/m.140356 type:complete len:87 (-) Transcript_64635:5-265(-)
MQQIQRQKQQQKHQQQRPITVKRSRSDGPAPLLASATLHQQRHVYSVSANANEQGLISTIPWGPPRFVDITSQRALSATFRTFATN